MADRFASNGMERWPGRLAQPQLLNPGPHPNRFVTIPNRLRLGEWKSFDFHLREPRRRVVQSPLRIGRGGVKEEGFLSGEEEMPDKEREAFGRERKVVRTGPVGGRVTTSAADDRIGAKTSLRLSPPADSDHLSLWLLVATPSSVQAATIPESGALTRPAP